MSNKKEKKCGSVIALAALVRHKGGPMKDKRKKRKNNPKKQEWSES